MNEVASNQPALDVTRLEKVRYAGEKITARCPACAEGGGDRGGSHLVILPSGKFACAAAQGDGEHRRRIFALAGIPQERDPNWRPDPREARQRQIARAKAEGEKRVRDRIASAAAEKRAGIAVQYAWEKADLWDDSPHRLDRRRVRHGPRTFLRTLFPPEAVVWAGETHHSGQEGRHAACWRTVADWCAEATTGVVGPMTAPAVWQPGTTSRTAANVAAAPYTVLDFDGFDGRAPQTEAEMQEHLAASLAIVRWLREALHWQLAAILHTGNKSLHAWFHTPPAAVLESLRGPAAALGLDANLLGRPEHPCRLPGQVHGKSGQLSEVWWLQAEAGH